MKKQEISLINRIKNSSFKDYTKYQMRETTEKLKEDCLSSKDVLINAFALVYEAFKTALKITPYDVQIQAAISMINENITEFPTGEGKTIVAVFVAYYKSLSKNGVHVLTFNDFLAKRDVLWMKPVYDLLGVAVDYISEQKTVLERKQAYNADVTYLTVKEAGYDYMRGFLAFNECDTVQRPLNFAIVDEADSIMIDNARIPIVVAGETSHKISLNKKIYKAVTKLLEHRDYIIDDCAKTVILTKAGILFLEKELNINLYSQKSVEELLQINLFLKAEYILKRNIDYIVKNDEIFIVDTFTGRVMKDCKWIEGIQSAVELKENLSAKNSDIVLNRITIQSFLNLYPNLCGMTGTAATSQTEFQVFYNKNVHVILPNKPCIRIDKPDVVFLNKEAKHKAIVKKVIEINKTKRPVLIGTGSIYESEELAKILRKSIPVVNVLNAKNDEEEGLIISNAGKLSAVTISTNMAGRGVDIAVDKEAVKTGGLYVMGTNRHESVRIDNQLRGRSGRQGEQGESEFYISLEDDIFAKSNAIKLLPTKFTENGCAHITSKKIRKDLIHIQKTIEGQHLNARISLYKYSMIYEQQRLLTHKFRSDILCGNLKYNVFDYFEKDLINTVSKHGAENALKAIYLYSINKCWSEHLQFMECLLDDVQIFGKSSEDTFLKYNEKLIKEFEEFKTKVKAKVSELCKKAVNKNCIDLNKLGVTGFPTTKTYMLLDKTEEIKVISDIAAVSNPFSSVLYMFYLLVKFFKKNK